MANNAITTLDQLIELSGRYDINKVTFFKMSDDRSLVLLDHTLFDVYSKLVEPYVKTYEVTDKQRILYLRRPHMLSMDIYGTPDLYWLILKLNDRECPSKFYLKRTIRLIPKDVLDDVYDTVVTKSKEKLEANWNVNIYNLGEPIV